MTEAEKPQTLPSFASLNLQSNADGWGPSYVPERKDVTPYAPFNKADRIGKVADWVSQANYQSRSAKVPVTITAVVEEEDFQLVEAKPSKKATTKKPFASKAKAPPQSQPQSKVAHNKGGGGGGGQGASSFKPKRSKPQKMQKAPQQYEQKRSLSVELKNNWSLLLSLPLGELARETYAAPEPTLLTEVGKLRPYNKTFDRVVTKTAKPLTRKMADLPQDLNRTAQDDPLFRHFYSLRKDSEAAAAVRRSSRPPPTPSGNDDSDEEEEEEEEGVPDCSVYVTGETLACLMASPKSFASWDVVVTKKEGAIFFDKRPLSPIDLYSVNETSAEPPLEGDSINSSHSLAAEHTLATINFLLNCLAEEQKEEAVESFGGEHERVAYQYRRWFFQSPDFLLPAPKKAASKLNTDLRVRGVEVVCRCRQDALNHTGTGPSLPLIIRSFFEFDSKGMDWRHKLDTQKGAIVATEIKNNAAKIHRWSIEANLADAQAILFGFISRTHPKDNKSHQILGSHFAKVENFNSQINLQMKNCWGVFRSILSVILRSNDGKYLLIKDPSLNQIDLYSIPLEEDFKPAGVAEAESTK